jgi:hypothetical protein
MKFDHKQITIAAGADYLGVMDRWFKDGWDITASTTVVKEGQQYILFFLKRERT